MNNHLYNAAYIKKTDSLTEQILSEIAKAILKTKVITGGQPTVKKHN